MRLWWVERTIREDVAAGGSYIFEEGGNNALVLDVQHGGSSISGNSSYVGTKKPEDPINVAF